jgi:hypothetical protein
MNKVIPTGLGEPEPAGKRVLFQPPVAQNRAEEHQPYETQSKGLEPVRKTNLHKLAKPMQRVRTTINLTPHAFEVIQSIQQAHRLKTGKALPLWKAVSQAIEHYGGEKGTAK